MTSDRRDALTAATARHERVSNTRHVWWHTAFKGRIYRPIMRLAHRWGWCYPETTLVEPLVGWCHWCGLRGRWSRPIAVAGKVGRRAAKEEQT